MRRALKAMVDMVSADLVGRGLAESGLPPLAPLLDGSAGAILFGSPFVAEQGAPPRVVIEWTGFGFAEPMTGMITGLDNPLAPTASAEMLRRWPARPLASVMARFKVHCWAIADTTPGDIQDPYADADATLELVCAVARSLINVIPGGTIEDRGTAIGGTDDKGAILNVAGQSAIFYFTSPIPVVDYAQELADPNALPTALLNLYLLKNDGTTEQGIPNP